MDKKQIKMVKLGEEKLYMWFTHLSLGTGEFKPYLQLGSFKDRKSLPTPWAGLSDKERQDVTGIDDAMLCHDGLFVYCRCRII